MANVIDVHDLAEEDVKILQELVKRLRERTNQHRKKKRDEVKFAVWQLGVKGNLTRKEIYESF